MIRKSMPSGFDRWAEGGFPKRSCSIKDLERDDDSTKAIAPWSEQTLPSKLKPNRNRGGPSALFDHDAIRFQDNRLRCQLGFHGVMREGVLRPFLP
jgi:hypothetical protein